MGYLNERHGMNIIGATPEGTCPLCASKHEEYLPHNQESITYQYKFYDQHGRWPTWEDAMEHCSDQIKSVWTEELRKRGVMI